MKRFDEVLTEHSGDAVAVEVVAEATGRLLLWTLLLWLTAASAFAQQSPSGEEELIKPSRPDVADSAEFQPAGVLQVEYGVDANFRSEEFRDQVRSPLSLRYAASRRLLLDLDLDAVSYALDEETRERETGPVRTTLKERFTGRVDSRPEALIVAPPRSSAQYRGHPAGDA